MALKAIDADGCIVVASAAEMFGVIGGIRTLDGVAVNTVLEPVGVFTQTFDDRFITLVIQQVHVVSAHEIGVSDTVFTLSPGDIRQQRVAV